MSFEPQPSSRIELDDSALLVHVDEMVKQSSVLTAELVVHRAEVEERRLHLELGYADMSRCCTEHLDLAEGEESGARGEGLGHDHVYVYGSSPCTSFPEESIEFGR